MMNGLKKMAKTPCPWYKVQELEKLICRDRRREKCSMS